MPAALHKHVARFTLHVADLENTAIASHIRHDHVASRNADFPHLYDVKLPRDAVVAAWALPLDAATGAFTFPPRELD